MVEKKTTNAKKSHVKKKSSTHHRKKPWTTGKGKFYRIELHPGTEYKTYRNQDVGKKWGLERLAGKKKTGERETASWLISKDHAHVANGRLVIDAGKDKGIMKQIKWPLKHVKGDVFRGHAKPRHTKKAPTKKNPTKKS